MFKHMLYKFFSIAGIDKFFIGGIRNVVFYIWYGGNKFKPEEDAVRAKKEDLCGIYDVLSLKAA